VGAPFPTASAPRAFKNPNAAHSILIIDSSEYLTGQAVAAVLQHFYHDTTHLVVGGDKGLLFSTATPPDPIFMYLWTRELHALDFCQQIRTLPALRQLPVVVWGAMSAHEIYPALQQAGASGYLIQPCNIETIGAIRNAMLQGATYYP
jgi:CheY-like chemotaxis protein